MGHCWECEESMSGGKMELIIQSIKSGEVYDITEICSSTGWNTDIDFSPGSLELELLKYSKLKINEGDIVRLTFDGVKVFFGKVFTKKKSQKIKGGWNLTCMDSMRYLKNKETMVVGPLASHELFTRICKEQELPYKVVDKSAWKAPSKVYDDKTLFEIIQDSLDQTLVNYGMWYIIRDNFGKLEHVALNSLITNMVIGDASLAKGYEYESSIDDSSNQVKLFKDNKDTGKREIYIVKDSKKIAEWGKLQFTEKVDDKLTPAQIKERANYIHKSLNKPTRTLKIPCIGNPVLRAGNSVILSISELVTEGFAQQQLAIIRKADHKWSDGKYEMNLDLVVV